MKTITKRAYAILIFVFAFFFGLGFMFYTFLTEGEQWVTHRCNTHIFSKNGLTVAGTVYDRNGAVLAATEDDIRIYNENESIRKATLHVVGDSSGYIATGVHSVYRANLLGYNIVNGIYPILSGNSDSNVKLTIDATVSKAAYEAMKGKKGTVAVYNYKTGEVICMVSAPTYDPANKPADISTDSQKYEGVYLNRAISGVFTPGSTFKTVTAIAAIENIPDIYERTFTCTGKYKTGDENGDGEVICNGTHGKLSFERALNVSCNSVFAELAIELGPEIMTQTVRDLGFTEGVPIGKITTVRSSFDVSDSTRLDLGWAGIGQYTTLVNPTQMLLLMGAIANGGTAVNPYIVAESSSLSQVKTTESTAIKLSPETAEKIGDMLRSNVKNYYGDKKFPSLEMCGKTGSAEVIGDKSHAWFVGFSQREDFPYAIVVCLQNGGIGYNDAIPVANKTLQALFSLQAEM